MRRQWVLVTADGPQLRDPLVAIRGLAAGGYQPAVAVSCGSSLAAASRYCLRRVDVPPCDDDGYAEAIRAELARGPYLAVLPASEAALLALGVTAPHLVDKVRLAETAAEVGIPSPPSRSFASAEEALAAASDLDYPVVVKPAVHRYYASRVETPAGLVSAILEDGPVVIQPFIDERLHAVSGVIWQGRLVAAAHERWLRIWRFHCGVATAAETVAPDRQLEERIEALLRGYEGYFHAQFAGPYLLDLNLRVHTSHPLAVAAGANLIAIYCDLLRGEQIGSIRARPGVFFRWIEGDLRHVTLALRRGEMSMSSALRALRPRRGAAHSTESLRDPGPMVNRFWYVARALVGVAS